ncbi:MAG: UTP--glucose-1-phosphate uridylyltransferase [Clostridia bacterium]|nr:UTP--glucose-1-phosphate uridylyltransferase [Clostridia bacterium]MBQ7121320.1 UTP--glucose-1-phosphate uridylyltransferase [Clostridia bacterium]
MKVRKAIIPAAGLGTRVLPASKSVPKEMLNIVDKPAIQYIVEEAVAAGIEDILIITNRGKGAIEDHFDHSFELEAGLKGVASKEKLYEDIKAVANLANIYFIRQKETKGLAHALLCGKSFVGNEPFAVLYGDDVIISEDPVTAQLTRCYEKYGKGVVGVNEVPEELIRLYCTLDVSPIEGEERAMNCTKIIEKPTPDQILSLYAILGRIVMPPETFDLIEKGLAATPEGKEFYLTDVFTELGQAGKLLAYDFDGKRYDMGNKLGIMKANCEVALNHGEIGEDFKAYLKELVKTF